MNWPTLEQIAEMESTEAYGLYYGLPPALTADHIAIIRALGDQAWKMRQEEDAGKPQPKFLPMPERVETPPPAPTPVSKPKPPPPAPKEEERGGSLFFLAALKP